MVDLIALANAVLNGKPAEDCSSTKTDRCAGSAASGFGSNNPATTIRIKKARPRIECHRLLGGLHHVGCSLLTSYDSGSKQRSESPLRVKRRHQQAPGPRLLCPPITDIERPPRDVRKVPEADLTHVNCPKAAKDF